MNSIRFVVAGWAVAIGLVLVEPVNAGRVFPGDDWAEATPESRGIDSAGLKSAVEELERGLPPEGAAELVIVRDGYLVWSGPHPDTCHTIFSCTKVFTSTVLGLLADDGKCSPEDLVTRHLPHLAEGYPDYRQLRLRHLATMTGGYQGVVRDVSSEQPWGDLLAYLVPQAPRYLGGTACAYHDHDVFLLGSILTRVAGERLAAAFKRRIADPIGMKRWDWGVAGQLDGGLVLNNVAGTPSRVPGIQTSARELARFGYLYLNRGRWRDRQLLSAPFIDQATSTLVPANLPHASGGDPGGHYGFYWWTNGRQRSGTQPWPNAPSGTYAAQGGSGNFCFVVPEWNLVVVRLGTNAMTRTAQTDGVWNRFFGRLGRALDPSPAGSGSSSKETGQRGPGDGPTPPIAQVPVVLDASYIAYERDVGDIDGDGDNDVVAVQEGDTTLQAFRAPDWTRSTLVSFSGTNRYPRADDLKLADIDGDGDLDVVSRLGPGPADDGPGLAAWCENRRNGREFVMHAIGPSREYVKDIVVADFDRDGHPDVAMRMDSRTQLWLQEPDGQWSEVVLTHPAHEGMEAGDLDGDGDPDLVLNGFWFPTPDTPSAARVAANYTNCVIEAAWFNQTGDWTANSCKVVMGDFDGDGRLDAAFSQSERPGYAISWYRSTTPHVAGSWTKASVAVVEYCHTLQAADFDLDGDVDLLAGGMIQSAHRGLRLFLNRGGGKDWREWIIQTNGSYSAELGDIDEDGDLDIVGIRNWNSAPTWIYRNTAADSTARRWTYHLVSAEHVRTFGLCFPDADGDGDLDIASGPFIYLNPGGGMTDSWAQVRLPGDVHAFATLDVDGDGLVDLLAQKDNPADQRIDLFWLEPSDRSGRSWNAPILVGRVPRSDHPEGFQGYRVAQMVPGGRPEIVISTMRGVYYLAVPEAHPEAGGWPETFVAANDSDEGIGVADIDGDGRLDISFTSGAPKEVKWARNPGDGRANWEVFTIGSFPEADWPDRCQAADLNGDGHVDIVVTEENSGKAPDALACWWEQPAGGATTRDWARHVITTRFTLNSLDVADVDGDGDVDLVLAEHRGARRIGIWKNDGRGRFTEQRVGEGQESHLGGRLVDLDGDGDLDLVSIAYDDFRKVHLWRNDAK